ncbi:high-affinity Fe2+/Pb2+ permease [Microbacteriaceae bacterium SG_E_30_P1]|uniref:High-affinity Fe2+/Pb2+ permease n=1 Tax=Antiquaquibacter oligotrophicus TaxID=2880260 RepID=A0ABT6KQ06_9MICO|nr:hypothetical protein [Antiquaquibacter oligotrophicus]MDH6182055.1 high-affinity Fe2+/Pb2+ permease [Antiquaquibacter oligotrophicus]UDF12277.1 hypothetical protein LH407_08885 [Antiquaquibacter oligotrophicus]
MDILHSILLTAHLLGMAVIVGTFLVQMRKNSDFAVVPVLVGAIVQLVSGIALAGFIPYYGVDRNFELVYVKIAVKLVIALAVLVAAILAYRAQKRGRRVKPFFHAAGGLALINVLVAVFWG